MFYKSYSVNIESNNVHGYVFDVLRKTQHI